MDGDQLQTYHAYGITIGSCVPLDLDPGRGRPDVVVHEERLPHVGQPAYWDVGSPFAGGALRQLAVRVPNAFAAEVRDGCEIALDPSPGLEPGQLGDFVLQPLLGYVMMQRGHLVLHASCVEIAGHAVVVVGASGQGKSTTAAALARRGHRLLCDDVVAVTADGRVVPGVARLKLWPVAAAALGLDPADLERCAGEAEKRRYRPPASTVTVTPVALRRIYVLSDAERLAVQPLSAAEALPELVRHSYGIFAVRETAQPEHFGRLTGVLALGLVRRLDRPRDLTGLDALSRLIEADVTAGTTMRRAD
jgi:hypothetical protein